MNISIVIPVYNEEKSIKEVIGKIKQAMSSTSHEYEIIAVNDCSTDKSQQILKTIQNIRVINHPINKGYGSSLKTGIKNASYEWIVIMDADGTYPAKSIPKLINGCENYDLVSGKRTGKNTKIPLLRRPAKFMLTYVANFLVGLKIPDLNCGLRLFRKSNVEKYLNILPERFSFTTTHLLLCIADNHKIKFVEISYGKRKGKSTIHPIKDFIRFLIIIFREGLLINPFKFFTTISILLIIIAALLFIIGYFALNIILDTTVSIFMMGALQIFLFGMLADLILRKLK